jgi:hypothetical protein
MGSIVNGQMKLLGRSWGAMLLLLELEAFVNGDAAAVVLPLCLKQIFLVGRERAGETKRAGFIAVVVVLVGQASPLSAGAGDCWVNDDS